MIVSREIEIPKTSVLTSEYIEEELKKQSIVPLRWAVVETKEKTYALAVSFEV